MDLDTLLRIPPLQLAHDLGMPVDVANHTIKLPNMSGEAKALSRGVVCHSAVGGFVAGSTLDLLVYHRTVTGIDDNPSLLGRYRSGVDAFLRMYMPERDTLREVESVASLAHQAAHRRCLFDFLVAGAVGLEKQSPAETVNLRSALHAMGTSQRPIPSIRVLSSGQHARLREALGNDPGLPPWDGPCYAIPFLRTPFEICGVEFRKTITGRPYYVEVLKSPIAYSGICGLGEREEILASSDPVIAEALQGRLAQQTYPFRVVGVRASRLNPGPTWSPGDMTFIYRAAEISEEQEIDLVTTAASVGSNIPDDIYLQDLGTIFMGPSSSGRRPGLLRPSEFVTRRVIDSTEEQGRLTHHSVKLLRALSMRPEQKAEICGALNSAGLYEAAAELETQFHDGVVWEDPSGEIVIRPTGYEYIDKKNTQKTQVTNFVLFPQASVEFPEQPGRYVRCKLQSHADTLNLTIPEQELETGKKLSDYLTMLPYDEGRTQTPRVIDIKRCSQLLYSTRKSLDRLPRVEGSSFYGWDGLRQKYFGPDFQIHKGGISLSEDIPTLPGCPEFKHFGITSDATPLLDPDLPAPICDLISQAIALAARHKAGYPVSPVLVRNNKPSQQAFLNLFRALGQESPVDLNFNQRAASKSVLRGFPFWALGLNHAQSKNFEAAAFILCDRGVSIAREYSDETWAVARRTFRHLFLAVIGKLIRGEISLDEPAHRVLYTSALVSEGSNLILQATDLIKWPQMQIAYPHIESILAEVSKEKVQDYFEFDMGQQLVYFHYKRVPNVKVDSTDLILEMASLVKRVDLHADGFLMFDSISAMSFLESYYNGKVTVTPVNMKALSVNAAVN